MKLTEGDIVYFDPFYFKNGNTAKPKYFVVLKSIAEKCVLASLPTRKNVTPKIIDQKTGCVELPFYNLNWFVISASETVTDCGKRFDFNTYIYGHQIDDYEISVLHDIYPTKDSDYYLWGRMKPVLFHQMVLCFSKSKAVKRKYKRMLNNKS